MSRYRYNDSFTRVVEWATVVCVIAIGIWAHFISVTVNDSSKQLAKESKLLRYDRRFLIESCVRLNILRAEDNLSHYADYHLFRVVYIMDKRYAARPRYHSKGIRQFLGVLRSSVDEKAWTPLTNCVQAVNIYGIAYRAPGPIKFVKRLPSRAELYPPARSPFLYVPGS